MIKVVLTHLTEITFQILTKVHLNILIFLIFNQTPEILIKSIHLLTYLTSMGSHHILLTGSIVVGLVL